MATTTAANTICFIGDGYADIFHEYASLYQGITTEGIGSLPIWDVSLSNLLAKYKSYNYIFLSCGMPNFGIRRIQELLHLNLNNAPSGRLVKFQGRDRHPWKDTNSKEIIPTTEFNWLLARYTEQIDYYLTLYPNIVLVPLANKFQLKDIPLQAGAYQDVYTLLIGKYKCIALDTISPTDLTNFKDSLWHLSYIGNQRLVALLNAYHA